MIARSLCPTTISTIRTATLLRSQTGHASKPRGMRSGDRDRIGQCAKLSASAPPCTVATRGLDSGGDQALGSRNYAAIARALKARHGVELDQGSCAGAADREGEVMPSLQFTRDLADAIRGGRKTQTLRASPTARGCAIDARAHATKMAIRAGRSLVGHA